jgi:hypothetical protein
MSLYELQIAWPDLPNQKKEYRKAEDLFKSGDVSDMRVSLEAKDVQVNGDRSSSITAATLGCNHSEH